MGEWRARGAGKTEDTTHQNDDLGQGIRKARHSEGGEEAESEEGGTMKRWRWRWR